MSSSSAEQRDNNDGIADRKQPIPATSGGWISMLSILNFTSAAGARKRLLPLEEHPGETQQQGLLRRRLGAVALVLFLARLAYTIRAVVIDNATANFASVITLGGLLTAFLVLSRINRFSIRWLRTIEWLMFVGMAVDFSFSLNQRLVAVIFQAEAVGTANTAQVVEFVSTVKDHIIGTVALMMVYAMFVPNTGPRAAAMVLLIGILPGVAILSSRHSREGLDTFRREHLTAVEKLRSTNLLSLAIGAGCAIYGTFVVNQLRLRAQTAEELGQYRLCQKVGSGGMGDVYLAEHRLLRRLCAVKLIRSDQASDPVMLARFEREVRATASLTHWNTIQIFDYGQTEDGRFFYVMEYLHGRNLLEIVRQFGPLPADRTVFILEQVCDALRESGAKGLVHRDIKPSNIFLAHLGERFDVVKLLDFGLVRPLASVGETDMSGRNQINGSPRYMCPEQAQGELPDIRGDLYSLGAVAYFLLSGRPPFESDNPLQLVISHATRTPPTFDEIGVDVPEDLERIIRTCLSKSPDERFSSPDALMHALHDLPQHGHWTWAIAEHWWRTSLPDVIGQDSGDFMLPDNSSLLIRSINETSAATDPTLIEIRPQP